MSQLTFIAGLIVDLFAGLLGLTILIWIWTGKISLHKLLSEPNGDASLSRLQFLIFTFVIALSFFLITVGAKDGPAFPNPIPAEVLTLLGISGSSYLVSKGIQFSNPAGVARPALTISPTALPPAGAALAVTVLTVSVMHAPAGTPIQGIIWSLDAPAHGTILPQPPQSAQYTPAAGIAAGTTVTIRAQAPGYDDATCVVTY